MVSHSGSPGGRSGLSPGIVHTWAIAGGASQSGPGLHRGLASPIASAQCRIIGSFTGSLPSRADV